MKTGDRVIYVKGKQRLDALVLRVASTPVGAKVPSVDLAFVHPDRLSAIGGAAWRFAFDRATEVPADANHPVHHYELGFAAPVAPVKPVTPVTVPAKPVVPPVKA